MGLKKIGIWWATALLCLGLGLLGGCGGGSDGGDSGSGSSASGSVPAITTQPASVSVIEGGSASFGVVASGSSLTYQWRKGGTAVAGATSATLMFSAVTSSDAGSYDVVVSNSAGSVTSSAATLTVTVAVTVPTITTQPTSVSVAAGGSASFSVVASGSGLSYQWRKAGTPISGATAAMLTLGNVGSSDAASYDVVVSNTAGSVTSSAATLSVTAAATAPTISTQPVAQIVAAGSSVSFTVAASGSGTLAYQWRKDGAAIAGATAATLTLSAVTSADAGSYDVVVANSAGSITSTAATLTVTSTTATAPTITTQPTSQSVAAGSSVSFSVAASGSGTLAYQWRKSGVAISGATASTYTITSVASTDAGSYDVIVSNSTGSITSSTVTLAVTTTTSGTLSTQVTSAAQAFLATLSSTQQATAQLTFTVDTARKWSNLPAQLSARNGLSWASLSSAQKTAARTLISTALGSTGNAMHIGWQMADNYLNANGGGSSYGEGQYYIVILGTPSATGFWLLQLTGHHLTFNIAFNGGYKSGTPAFIGIEPKGSFTYSGTTYDPMAAQRDAIANLGSALTAYSAAKLSGTYADLLFGANGTGGIDGSCPRAYSSVTEHGMLYSALTAAQQTLVQSAIKAYVNSQADEIASDMLSAYLGDSALAATYVAYSGSGTVTANGNYFRIEGPRLWIEFSVQRGVIFSNDIHFHTVWRDKVADYGGKCVQ